MRTTIFFSILIIILTSCNSTKLKCSKFYAYNTKKISVKEISSKLKKQGIEIADLSVAEISVDPKHIVASEELQRLDLLQYSLCAQINGLPRKDTLRKNVISKYVNALLEMMKIATTVISEKKNNSNDKGSTNDISEEVITNLRQSECAIESSSSRGTFFFYGRACFENQTDFDLILTFHEYNPFESTIGKILITKGERNCSPKILINQGGNPNLVTRDVSFTFTTSNASTSKRGNFNMTLEKCKIKSIVLTQKNLYLEVAQ